MTGWAHDDRTGRFESQFQKEETMTGAKNLFASRRFWTLLIDVLVSLVIYFGGKYAGAYMDDIRFLIVALQPVALLLIAAYTVDDMTAARVEMTRMQIDSFAATRAQSK